MTGRDPQAEVAFAIVIALLVSVFSIALVVYLGQFAQEVEAIAIDQPLIVEMAAASRWYWLLIAMVAIGGALLVWLGKRLEGWLALGISAIVSLAALGFTVYAAYAPVEAEHTNQPGSSATTQISSPWQRPASQARIARFLNAPPL